MCIPYYLLIEKGHLSYTWMNLIVHQVVTTLSELKWFDALSLGFTLCIFQFACSKVIVNN